MPDACHVAVTAISLLSKVEKGLLSQLQAMPIHQSKRGVPRASGKLFNK